MLLNINFMGVMESSMNGVFRLFLTDLNFPEPIGMTSPGDILLFFGCMYLLADTFGGIAERGD